MEKKHVEEFLDYYKTAISSSNSSAPVTDNVVSVHSASYENSRLSIKNHASALFISPHFFISVKHAMYDSCNIFGYHESKDNAFYTLKTVVKDKYADLLIGYVEKPRPVGQISFSEKIIPSQTEVTSYNYTKESSKGIILLPSSMYSLATYVDEYKDTSRFENLEPLIVILAHCVPSNCVVEKGFSGGPVVNNSGDVLGLTVYSHKKGLPLIMNNYLDIIKRDKTTPDLDIILSKYESIQKLEKQYAREATHSFTSTKFIKQFIEKFFNSEGIRL